jgi:hypothetical protein
MLYKIEIPVTDCMYQDLYFEKDSCPAKEEVVKEVMRLNERDLEEGSDDWENVLKSIESAEGWPSVGGNCIACNTFCKIDEISSKKPLTIKRITPCKL